MAFSVFLVDALDNDIFSINSTHFGSVASVHRTDLTLAYRFEYVNPHLRHYSISLKSPFLTSDHNFKLVDSQSAAMSFESENVNYASLAMNTETSELQLRDREMELRHISRSVSKSYPDFPLPAWKPHTTTL